MQCPPPPDIVVEQTYEAVLDRPADLAGRTYWVTEGLDEALFGIIGSPEAAELPEPTIETVYDRLFDREPAPEALAFWSSKPLEEAIWGIVTSPESTGCAEWLPFPDRAPATVETSQGAISEGPPGWVDGGHGVLMPPELFPVRGCESGTGPNDPVGDYQAKNPRSSARGAWQFLTGTWQWVTGLRGVATDYSPAVQDRAAVDLYELVDGDIGSTMAWGASEGCWR